MANEPQFLVCDINNIGRTFAGQQFDLVFSNFAGLNCLDPAQMSALGNAVHTILQPGGHLALVLFGKYCSWETIYYLLKFKPKEAFRRWGSESLDVQLKDNVQQPVFYYSTGNLRRYFQGFNIIYSKPVGLFIPPSYLEKQFSKHPKWLQKLNRWEKRLGKYSLFSPLADHYCIILKQDKQ